MPRIARRILYAIIYAHHITQHGNNRETGSFEAQDKEFYLKTLNKYIGVRDDILPGNGWLKEKKLETYRNFLREED